MRRFFPTFVAGAPGAGLLVLRAVAGIAFIANMAAGFSLAVPLDAAMAIASGTLGAFLLAGLGTPVVGVVATLDALRIALSWPRDPGAWVLVAAIALALALLGPGIWSIDARLFGWKRLDFGDTGRRVRSPD